MIVQRNEVIVLAVTPKVLANPFEFILEFARGKRVLNVGAAGGVENYLPHNRDLWLHQRLIGVADEVVGIDVDAEAVKFARQHGVDLIVEDCESCCFSRLFDVIVMSDVIEHVNAPVRAIDNLGRQLSSSGRLIITTPNPTHYGLVLRAWLRRHTSVYYDHVGAFLPEHIQAIANRSGLRLTDIAFFTHFDSRTVGNRVKSRIGRFLGSMVPRTHSSFLAVLVKSRT